MTKMHKTKKHKTKRHQRLSSTRSITPMRKRESILVSFDSLIVAANTILGFRSRDRAYDSAKGLVCRMLFLVVAMVVLAACAYKR